MGGDDNRRAWAPWLEELERRRAEARAMGGADRVERLQHARGRLDARQRIAGLFDAGSFVELGTLVGGQEGLPADGYVCGSGRIDGRPALAGAEDFSLLGGSIGSGGTAKRFRLAELARQERVPLVLMLEGAGHRLTETHASRAPHDLLALADLAGRVPMVCLVLGAAAGHSALAAPLCDFVVMTRDAAMFSGGPPLVKAATGEEVSQQELGGPGVCAEHAGTAHAVADDDEEALALARRYLAHLPSRAGGARPRRPSADDGPRPVDALLDILPPNPRKPYDVRDVIGCLVDEARVMEIQPGYGAALVTALAHLGGRPVAFVANNPAVGAGAIDAAAAIKAADFLERLDPFGLPVVFLTDNPGVLAGRRAEREGILKWGGRLFQTQRRLRSPKINVLLRKGFGFGLVAMAATPFDRQILTLALPAVNLAAMPAASGGRAAGLEASEQERVEAAQREGPWALAHGLGVDEVVDPRELRDRLLEALALADGRA